MSEILTFLLVLLVCGSLLMLTFLVLLALPQSKLRAVVMPIVGWTVAIFCAIYCISPIDIVPEAVLGPFGLIDDLAAFSTGIASAYMAYNAKKPE